MEIERCVQRHLTSDGNHLRHMEVRAAASRSMSLAIACVRVCMCVLERMNSTNVDDQTKPSKREIMNLYPQGLVACRQPIASRCGKSLGK